VTRFTSAVNDGILSLLKNRGGGLFDWVVGGVSSGNLPNITRGYTQKKLSPLGEIVRKLFTSQIILHRIIG